MQLCALGVYANKMNKKFQGLDDLPKITSHDFFSFLHFSHFLDVTERSDAVLMKVTSTLS